MLKHIKLEHVKKFDSFAKSVQFTFRGKESYATIVGGVISIICFVLFTLMFLVKTISLYSKDDPELNMYETNSDFAKLDLHSLGFMLAMEKVDPRIGKI